MGVRETQRETAVTLVVDEKLNPKRERETGDERERE